jgi:hypothetical protein
MSIFIQWDETELKSEMNIKYIIVNNGYLCTLRYTIYYTYCCEKRWRNTFLFKEMNRIYGKGGKTLFEYEILSKKVLEAD